MCIRSEDPEAKRVHDQDEALIRRMLPSPEFDLRSARFCSKSPTQIGTWLQPVESPNPSLPQVSSLGWAEPPSRMDAGGAAALS